jgi:hypothetical protein
LGTIYRLSAAVLFVALAVNLALRGGRAMAFATFLAMAAVYQLFAWRMMDR